MGFGGTLPQHRDALAISRAWRARGRALSSCFLKWPARAWCVLTPCFLLFQTQQLGARREYPGPKAAPGLPEEVRTLTARVGRGRMLGRPVACPVVVQGQARLAGGPGPGLWSEGLPLGWWSVGVGPVLRSQMNPSPIFRQLAWPASCPELRSPRAIAALGLSAGQSCKNEPSWFLPEKFCFLLLAFAVESFANGTNKNQDRRFAIKMVAWRPSAA